MSTAAEGDAADLAEAQYVKAKTSVWWDIENCQVPKGLDAHGIAQHISSALVKMNYCGPVNISAYGDTNRIPPSIQHALSSTGIALNHVPSGVKDASDKKILVDMLFWAVDNPAPANFMLISGDRDFSNALHQLRMRRYNILLAQPQKASAPLIAAAKTVWLWTSLAVGGPPLTRGESSQLIANGRYPSDSERSTLSVAEQVQSSQSMDPNPDARRIMDNKNKVKFTLKPSKQVTGLRVQEPKDLSRQQQPAQGKQFMKAPHEFFGNSDPNSTSRPAPNTLPNLTNPVGNTSNNVTGNPQNHYHYPPRPSPLPVQQPYHNPDPSLNNGNGISNNTQNHYPAPARPGGFAARPSYGPNNLQPPVGNGFRPMHPRNDGPRFPYASATNLPDIGNLNLSQYPNHSQNRPNFNPKAGQEFRPNVQHPSYPPSFNGLNDSYVSQVPGNTNSSGPEVSAQVPKTVAGIGSSNAMWGTPGSQPPPSEHVQGLIGVILLSLNTLKNEKIMPTEHNIADCIRYGDPKHRGTDVKKALASAIEHHMIAVTNVGKLRLYIGKYETLWKCVNPLGGNPRQYPKATWDRIRRFLTSSSGRAAIMATQCRFEAAQVMKKECLYELTLGDVLQIMNITATSKKWITHHQSGWQPITITLAAEDTDEAGTTRTGA
ncbi:PREDICTED: uncharacterized protein LOC104802123 [Tarenaya hassleriana]|uniref:uncharacterized protein LOC104802123 n=1 Tax=Tarenaya hassleriana TaxID=28532 RepID=UPI00053C6416|nr:PREDICTED: uncharacterized protein LOC104802123 [Tarenaya hassleriana]